MYILVSPLTLWTVEIPRNAINRDVDWTNATSLSLFFTGSIIPTSTAGFAQLAGARASRTVCRPHVRARPAPCGLYVRAGVRLLHGVVGGAARPKMTLLRPRGPPPFNDVLCVKRDVPIR